MFSKKDGSIQTGRANENTIETIIGPGVVFEGKITGNATIRVDGSLIGDTSISGLMIVGETGQVTGNVDTDRLLVAGRLEGQVKAAERVEIVSGGYLVGDVQTASFVVADGATFNGNCRMGSALTIPLLEESNERFAPQPDVQEAD